MHYAIVFSGIFNLILFVAIFVFVIIGFILQNRRVRSEALEWWIAEGKCGPVSSFAGTLAVEQAGSEFLRLVKNDEAARLQLKYRWMSAISEQADYDEVTFDGSQHVVELKKKDKVIRMPFGRFSAVRMRELSQSDAGSLWHFDLVATDGKNVLFVSSARGDRRTMFENSAGLAKVISAITSLPVQVVVAGNVWTPGWPPTSSTEN